MSTVSTTVYPPAPRTTDPEILEDYAHAIMGNPEAMINLGFTSEECPDIIPFAEGLEWYKLAAEQDHPAAEICLGDLYFAPGPHHDISEAKKWYGRASDCDCHADAMRGLIEVFGDQPKEFFEGCEEELYDIDCDWPCFKPVELGDRMFIGTDNVGFDLERAFMLYKYAAKDDDPEALRKVGYMYENGLGTEESLEKAAEYYQRADLAGDKDALWLLTSLEERTGRFFEPNLE